MAENLGSLVVDLKLETAALRKGVDDAVKIVTGLDSKLSSIGKAISDIHFKEMAGVIKDAAMKLGEFVLKGAETADQMGKMAQSAGISVESMSKLDYAAGLSGISTEQLGTALDKLNKNLAAAGAGAKDQTALFHALGVSVKDASGNVRSTDEVLSRLADRFSNMKDGASKTALAMEVFGKSGAQLIPFLNEGAAGIAELANEAERLGIVIDDKAAASAERFNDAVEKIERAVNGVATRTAAELTPALSRLADQFLNSKEAANALRESAVILATFFKVLATGALGISAALQSVGIAIAGFASEITSMVKGEFGEVQEGNDAAVEEMKGVWSAFMDHMDALWSKAPMEDALDKTKNNATETADHVLREFERVKKGIDTSEIDLAYRIKGITDKGVAQSQADEDRSSQGGFTGGNTVSKLKDYSTPELERAKEKFRDLADATDTLTQAQIGYEIEMANAAKAKQNNDLKAYEFAMEAADAQKQVAEQANEASQAFRDAATHVKSLGNAMDGIIDRMMSKMGMTGEIIGSAAQGFQAGGIWGAIIAAIAELLSNSKQFMEIIGFLNDFFKMLADSMGSGLNTIVGALKGIEPLLGAIGRLFEALNEVVNALHGASEVTNAVRGFANFLKNIVDLIGLILRALAGLANALSGFELVTKILTPVFNMLSLTILGTINGIRLAAEWILRVVHGIAKFFGADTTDIERLFNENAAEIKLVQQRMKNIWENIMDPNADTEQNIKSSPIDKVDTIAPPAGAAADSLNRLAKAADEVTDSLTNVPTGYKVAARRFESTAAETPPASLGDIFRDLGGFLERNHQRRSFVDGGNPFPLPIGGG